MEKKCKKKKTNPQQYHTYAVGKDQKRLKQNFCINEELTVKNNCNLWNTI